MSLNIKGLPQPQDNDFQERIEVDLKKGMPLEVILADTKNLIREFDWTAARCTYQVRIYRDLQDYIERRIAVRDIIKKEG